MPASRPRPLPFTAATLAALLCLQPALAAPGRSTAGTDVEAAVDRCLALRRSEPGTAISEAERILARADLQPEPEIKALACLGMAAAIVGDAARANAAVERIGHQLDAYATTPEFALRALSNAGAILQMTGEVHGALEYYVRAWEAARDGEAAVAQAVALTNIGIIHSAELGAYAVADGYFDQALALSKQTGREDPILHYNHALNSIRMGRGVEALGALERAAEGGRRLDQSVVALRADAARVAVLEQDEATDAGRERLEAIAAEQAALPDPAGAALTRVQLSGLALRAGNAAAALQHARAAEAATSGPGFRAERVAALEALIAAQRALQRPEQALETAERLRQLEVSALKAQNLAALAGLQARLLDAGRDREIQALRQQDLQRAEALDQSRTLRNWAVAGVLLLAVALTAFALYQRRVTRTLRHLGAVDPLTGLLNRGAAARRLDQMVVSAQEAPVDAGDDARRGTVFLVDVDRFKQINDRHGHSAGDSVLIELAGRLARACRPNDVIARWGGEEFLVACFGLDQLGAAAVAERLRTAVASQPLSLPGGAAQQLTISLGFACWPFFPARGASGSGWQQAVSLADRALYAAKRSGRDAWVGLCGRPGREAALATVVADPERFIALGDVTVVASQAEVRWADDPADSSGPAPESTEHV